MRDVAVQMISLYQILLSTVIKQLFGIPMVCRYRPTCSLYMQQMIGKYGILKGGSLGLKRLLSCHPFTRYESV